MKNCRTVLNVYILPKKEALIKHLLPLPPNMVRLIIILVPLGKTGIYEGP